MPPRPIIIDCDPGQDDALALLLALGSPDELAVLAVTAVAGNVPLALTQENARKVVELAGRRDLPVHAGAERPLVRAPVTAEFVHGATGLDGAELPPPTIPLASAHGDRRPDRPAAHPPRGHDHALPARAPHQPRPRPPQGPRHRRPDPRDRADGRVPSARATSPPRPSSTSTSTRTPRRWCSRPACRS